MSGTRFLVLAAAVAAVAACNGADDEAAGPATSGGGQAGGGGSGGSLAGAAGAGSPGGTAGSAGKGGTAGTGGAAGACDPGNPPPPGGTIGDDLFKTLADRKLVRIADDGTETSFQLHDAYAPCGPASFLVLRLDAPWCGQCEADADQVAPVLAPLLPHGVTVLTVLLSGRENAAARAEDVAAFRAKHPTLPGVVARDASGTASDLVRKRGALPMIYLVDRRTMRVAQVAESPTQGKLFDVVANEITLAGGPKVPYPLPLEAPLLDDRFDERDWALVKGLSAPPPPPPDPSNAFEGSAAAAALGQTLFSDGLLGGASGVSCAVCHDPSKGFSDGLSVAKGVAVGSLNTPTLFMAAHARRQFWDGRADSLWSQALGPIENPIEMAGSRLGVAHRVASTYAKPYEALFGPLPDLADTKRFPLSGKPGDAAYDGMTAADREAVTRVFVNVAKSIAAFERTIPAPASRLDAYVAGKTDALTPLERDGLVLFLRAGCITCHHGPAATDGAFHAIRMPSHADGGPGDRGRIDGAAKLLASPFRRDGAFSDDKSAGAELATLVVGDEMLGQMKTPTLRGLAQTGPYGHGGTFETLDQVTSHYAQVTPLPDDDPRTVGERDAAMPRFSAAHVPALTAFVAALGGAPAPLSRMAHEPGAPGAEALWPEA